jgi:hypothetical protein
MLGIGCDLSQGVNRRPQNVDLLRQRKIRGRYLRMTARPGLFASLHLTIFERPANFEFFEQSVKAQDKPF